MRTTGVPCKTQLRKPGPLCCCWMQSWSLRASVHVNIVCVGYFGGYLACVGPSRKPASGRYMLYYMLG